LRCFVQNVPALATQLTLDVQHNVLAMLGWVAVNFTQAGRSRATIAP
jgi:hypothetical protein